MVKNMEKVKWYMFKMQNIMPVTCMKVNGKMIREMEKVNINGLVVLYMQGTGNRVRNMEEVKGHLLQVLSLMVTGTMRRQVDTGK